MSKIFISYRRDDSADVTDRIYDRLVCHFGKKAIVRDVESIPLGRDFRRYLVRAVERCQAFLAVIGRSWLATLNQRQHEPDDFVRIEIEMALRHDIAVIPVPVQGAAIPSAELLPPGVRGLVHRQGLAVRRDPDFHGDMDRLIKHLDGSLGAPPPRLRCQERLASLRAHLRGDENVIKGEYDQAIADYLQALRHAEARCCADDVVDDALLSCR